MSGGYGVEFIRALLVDIDRLVAALDAAILSGLAREKYGDMLSERRGLLKARMAVVDRCDTQTRQILGIPVDPPQARRAGGAPT